METGRLSPVAGSFLGPPRQLNPESPKLLQGDLRHRGLRQQLLQRGDRLHREDALLLPIQYTGVGLQVKPLPDLLGWEQLALGPDFSHRLHVIHRVKYSISSEINFTGKG